MYAGSVTDCDYISNRTAMSTAQKYVFVEIYEPYKKYLLSSVLIQSCHPQSSFKLIIET